LPWFPLAFDGWYPPNRCQNWYFRKNSNFHAFFCFFLELLILTATWGDIIHQKPVEIMAIP
jgi:hypothetical protein